MSTVSEVAKTAEDTGKGTSPKGMFGKHLAWLYMLISVQLSSCEMMLRYRNFLYRLHGFSISTE